MTKDEKRLQDLKERVYELVSSVHGVLSKSLVDEVRELEKRLGRTWDPACQSWQDCDQSDED
jgi:hypothetical protein